MTMTTTATVKKLLLFFLIFAGLYYTKAFLMPCVSGAFWQRFFYLFAIGWKGGDCPKVWRLLSVF